MTIKSQLPAAVEATRTAAQQGADQLAATKRHPVIEVFGPTVQGEGPDAGRACYFVRFGGCDYRCTWCDSMHAVDPATVRATAERLTANQILDRIDWLRGAARLVVLSGGNPALHHLAPVVDVLQRARYQVSVETQGSVWRPWLGHVDRLVVSHKPPSSDMHTVAHTRREQQFMRELEWAYGHSPARRQLVALKPVVFDADDLAYAIGLHRAYPDWPMYLSVGTDRPEVLPDGQVIGDDTASAREVVCERWRWLCEQVAVTPDLNDVRVLPQLHVLAWGHAQGR